MNIFSTTNVSSVFGLVGTSATASNIAQIVGAQEQKRLQQKLTALGDSYAPQFREMDSRLASLQTQQQKAAEGASSLKAAKSSLLALNGLFESMTDVLKEAADPANTAYAAQSFQSKMITLRNMTVSSPGNMLSGPDQRIAYEVGTNGAEVVFYGQNMGSSYTIVASDNHVWAPNEGGTALVAYDSYPDKTAGASSGFFGGTVLNSLNGSAVDFTVGKNGGAPQTLTGTFASKGVGLLDSWLYDEFATAAGRARAAADLKAAQAAVTAESYRYDFGITVAEYHSSKLDLEISVLSNKQTELTEEQALKAADLQEKFKQTQAALSLAYQGAATAGIQIVGLLPTAGSLLTSAAPTSELIDIFA